MKSHNAHQSVEAVEKTLASILDIIREGVWDWNAGTGNVWRSPGWYRMLGYEVDSLKEDVLTWENIIHPDDYARVMAHFEAYIKGESDRYRIEYRCRRKDGKYLWVEDTGRIIERTAEGKVLRMIGAHLDIDDVKRAQQKLERQNALLLEDKATLETLVEARTAELDALNKTLRKKLEYISHIASHDPLTSVYNRYMFEELVHKEISRARRYERPLSFIMADVDYFKRINDTHGHKTGDAVLAGIAGALRHSVRDSDYVARWGGEEFVIILPDTTKREACALAEVLRKTIEQIVFEKGVTLTCSFGVTALCEGDTVNTVFNRIDTAMYRAKEFERNNVQCE
jgi:diguanylate cyclase (GGDEF)-like protein/PAS domain S-box-containing protein